ncbi:MAG TPA: CPBP family intramembrane glutamic endopeptidase [Mycobacteriales bacterium]|nr:CPBP family intramembrane glutamic endopeptidase [Mycobacteriales bacterium]
MGLDAVLPERRVLRTEVLVVFAVSLGAAGVTALLTFLVAVTAAPALSSQRTSLVSSYAPGRPWLDLLSQLVFLALALAPVALVAHLLGRTGESLRGLGLDLGQRTRDLVRGAALAALIGGSGLALYLVAVRLGLNRTVIPSSLPAYWWRVPVQLLVALQNAVLEEVLVAGYLLRRLNQHGWRPWPAVAVSAVLRGSYHLYQGLGGFVGNVAMGVLFARLYQRWGRIGPLVVAHALIDAVALVGFTLLVGRVGWLPT